jgi:hypothetical protein
VRARASLAAVLAIGTGTVIAARPQTTSAGQQVFRASTDLVTVDVSVRRGGDHVDGLSAKDFVLTDNGVPQQIDLVESSVVPVDVTLLVDTNREVDDQIPNIVAQARRIATMLRPTDRLRVWNISTSVSEVAPLELAGSPPTVPVMVGGGLAAVYDALGATLMEPVAADGRHLIIAITNGIDTDSVLTLETVRALAERTNATLHISQIDVAERQSPSSPDQGAASTATTSPSSVPWTTSREDLREFECGREGHCQPNALFWQPHYAPPRGVNRFDPLADVAAATGGKLHTLGPLVEHNAADVFANAFKDFQENYLLRYRPQGAARVGWHTIAVTVPAFPGYTIHARRGYAIEDGPAPAPAPELEKVPAPGSPSGPLADELVRDYAQGDYTAMLAAAEMVSAPRRVAGLREAGNLWPTSPHREAVFTLELAQVWLTNGLEAARKPVCDWLAAEGHFVRNPLGPDAFEHDWLAAELALLEAPIRPGDGEPFVGVALERFPADPRFLFDAALLADQRLRPGSPDALSPAQAAKQVANAVAKYDAVIAHPEAPELVAEALLRSAWLLHRATRDLDALARLNRVQESDADLDVRYLRQLFKGHVLTSLGRPAEAATAYRAAVDLIPGGEAGRVALMNGLIASGDRQAALSLSESIQATPPSVIDPWHLYWQGDYRHFPEAIAHLRALVR